MHTLRFKCTLADVMLIYDPHQLEDRSAVVDFGDLGHWPPGITNLEFGLQFARHLTLPVSGSYWDDLQTGLTREVDRIGRIVTKGDGVVKVETCHGKMLDHCRDDKLGRLLLTFSRI